MGVFSIKVKWNYVHRRIVGSYSYRKLTHRLKSPFQLFGKLEFINEHNFFQFLYNYSNTSLTPFH